MFKVLLADDEPLVLIGIQGMIDWGSLGWEVSGMARNGSEALRLINETQPDLVLCDIRMPLMDGLELAAKCRETDEALPVFIMLTSYEEFSYVNLWLALLGGAVAGPFWAALNAVSLQCFRGSCDGWFGRWRGAMARMLAPAAAQGAALGLLGAGLTAAGSFFSALLGGAQRPALFVWIVIAVDLYLLALAATLLFPSLALSGEGFESRMRGSLSMLTQTPGRVLGTAAALLVWSIVLVGLFPASAPYPWRWASGPQPCCRRSCFCRPCVWPLTWRKASGPFENLPLPPSAASPPDSAPKSGGVGAGRWYWGWWCVSACLPGCWAPC